MSTYNFTKNPPTPKLLQPGVPAYAFGSRNPNLPTVRMAITNVSLTTNVATYSVTMLEGNIPAAGDLASVTGTSTASGAFNVIAIALASVNIDATTGIGTVTLALTHANVGSIAQAGLMSVEVPEVPQLLSGATKSAAFALQAAKGQGRGISWDYNCPSAPGSASIQLEGALVDDDAEYAVIGSALTSTSAGQAFATAPENVNFVRINAATFSAGTNPSIVARISQS